MAEPGMLFSMVFWGNFAKLLYRNFASEDELFAELIPASFTKLIAATENWSVIRIAAKRGEPWPNDMQ